MRDDGRQPDSLGAGAGSRTIRGGGIRLVGYGVQAALAAAASIVLLRYLGPASFGRYVTVLALIGIVAEVGDAGIAVVGQRRYVVELDREQRRRLLGTLVGIRSLLIAGGVAVALCFGLLADYPTEVIVGIAIAGGGLIVGSVGVTFSTVLYAELRFRALTAIDLVRQVVVLAWIAFMVAVGGGLVAIFGSQVAAGIATTTITLAVLRPYARTGPRFRPDELRSVLAEGAPIALSQAVTVVYARGLVVMMSILESARETGFFAASYRVVDMLLAVPAIMLAVAFPVLAHAGVYDERRLLSALGRLAETALLLAILLALILGFGARPLVHLLGGHDYGQAVPVLRIQAPMLVGAFLTQVWGYGFLAARRERALVAFNILALLTLSAAGIPLILGLGARGAALTGVIVETLFAAVAVATPRLARPGLQLQLGRVLKMFSAAGVAVLGAVVSGLPDAPAAALSGVIYVTLVVALGAVPPGIVHALRSRPGLPATPSENRLEV